MHSDSSLSFEDICSRLFSLFIISSFEHISHILTLMIELRNLQIHRERTFLNKQKIEEYQSKTTFAKDRNSDEFERRQHERTSNSNVFDQNHKIRRQKENIEWQKISNIERQRASNIRAITKSETKRLKRQRKKLKEETFAKEENSEIDWK